MRPGETDTATGVESVRAFLRALEEALQGRVPVRREPIVSAATPAGALAC